MPADNQFAQVQRGQRHRVQKESKINNASIRRLARRGGVKRINSDLYDRVNELVRKFLQDVLMKAVIYAEHAQRKTVSKQDIILALKKSGHILYI